VWIYFRARFWLSIFETKIISVEYIVALPLYLVYSVATEFMPLPADSVYKGIGFSDCPIHSFGQSLLPRYLMNGLSNLDETYGEYSVAPTDALSRLWTLTAESERSVTAGRLGGESIQVDARAYISFFKCNMSAKLSQLSSENELK